MSVYDWAYRTFEISHSSHSKNSGMEGLRGFAVFLVFLVHYVTLVDPWLSHASLESQIGAYVRNIGNAGVDLFFVLSGYLIYGMLIKKCKPIIPYLRRRLVRIYPTFLVVFLVYILLSFIFPAESKIPDSLSNAVVYLIQNLFLLPGLFNIEPVITVAWSLSYEFFYYLIVPFFIMFTFMRSWTDNKRLIFVIFLTICLFTFFYFENTHIRMVMFLSGILLFELTQLEKKYSFSTSGIFALLAAIFLMVVIKQHQIDYWWRFIVLYFCFLVLCLDAFDDKSLTSRIFSFTPLRWFGNISYSYYLIHGLALKAGFMILSFVYPPTGSDSMFLWLLVFPMFLLSLVPSILLFMSIEKPFSLTVRAKN